MRRASREQLPEGVASSGQVRGLRIVYVVSAIGNTLYGGGYRVGDRFQTYGQHSFIFDLATTAARLRIPLTLAIAGMRHFPLTHPVAQYCRVVDFAQLDTIDADLVLVDELPDALLESLPRGLPTFCLVHNAAARYSDTWLRFCDRFVCMTETAVQVQSRSHDPQRLLLIRQGVDVQRFTPRGERPRGSEEILIYTRLTQSKAPTLTGVIEQLLEAGRTLTVLGDGDAFWEISDRYGERVLLIQHIPTHSLPRFLAGFDVVVSSGRGVMEALSCGIPTLCAGLGYAGPVTGENINSLLRANFTAYGWHRGLDLVPADAAAALRADRAECRRLAEAHCSMEEFLVELLAQGAGLRDGPEQPDGQPAPGSVAGRAADPQDAQLQRSSAGPLSGS